MNAKRILAVGMLLLTCAWSAWLFGSVNWAGAQKERMDSGYSADTGLLVMADSLEPRERTLRGYLQEAEKIATTSAPRQSQTERTKSRDVFSGHGRASGEDQDLEIIHINQDNLPQKVKPSFPIDRFKLTGVMLGPDPRAFVLDPVENKTRSLRIGDRIDNGTVKGIDESGLTVEGDFGAVKLKRNP